MKERELWNFEVSWILLNVNVGHTGCMQMSESVISSAHSSPLYMYMYFEPLKKTWGHTFDNLSFIAQYGSDIFHRLFYAVAYAWFFQGGGGGFNIACMPWSMLRQAWKSWGGGAVSLFFLPQIFWVHFSRHGVGVSIVHHQTLTNKKRKRKKKVFGSKGEGVKGVGVEPPPLHTRLILWEVLKVKVKILIFL